MRMVINQLPVTLDLAPGRVLLDVLRRNLGLTGVKEGCREGDCGACSVLLGRLCGDLVSYQTVVSCLLPIGDCANTHLVTIEGLNQSAAGRSAASAADVRPGGSTNLPLNPIQQAFIDQGAVQCGFCTPGLVVSLTGYLLVGRNLERRGGAAQRGWKHLPLHRLRRHPPRHPPGARRSAAGEAAQRALETLISAGYLPDYFRTIPGLLAGLAQPADSAPETGKIVVAGGTDLFVQKPEELETAPLELLSSRKELQSIAIAEGWCRIGGGVTVEDAAPQSGITEYPSRPAGLPQAGLLHPDPQPRNCGRKP